MTREDVRLTESQERKKHWKRWGPYLAERAWGTVREDYSSTGNAWGYFPHDHARSRAYRWTEDGLAGICDRYQKICFALALWNERDPILKERLFGLTGKEGNHGEDVKECYFYLDSTPTHSYMRYLYKYPHSAFPYAELLEENHRRGRDQPEYELLDTGVFNENRYFDVFVEYAKADVEDILIRIKVENRGPEAARLRVLPTIWFRNTWSWGGDDTGPKLHLARRGSDPVFQLEDPTYGKRWLICEGSPGLLFTENETNTRRLFGVENGSPYVKDGINNYIVQGERKAVNPETVGTKAAAHYALEIASGQSVTIRLRLTDIDFSTTGKGNAFDGFDAVFASRQREADEFYATAIPQDLSPDAQNIMRQGFAGMLWSKQFYHYVVKQWLEGDPENPIPPAERLNGRNHEWQHLYNADVISMPDKWEYPWYAGWDLAFHCIPLALIDPDYAKEQ
ncbi:MAG TPA: glucosidase, partial [Candidatus Sulfotelmatobacter sp.]